MIKSEIYIILDGIRSRENVGSIFRTADGAGVSKIYFCGITPTPPHDKISKTALGAEEYVPWEYHKQTWSLIKGLKKGGFKIIALEQTKNSKNIFEFKIHSDKNVVGPAPESPKATRCGTSPEPNLVLVLGNEVQGISSKILSYCDSVVHIPMHGRKESLNVSVAVGVALYSLIGPQF